MGQPIITAPEHVNEDQKDQVERVDLFSPTIVDAGSGPTWDNFNNRNDVIHPTCHAADHLHLRVNNSTMARRSIRHVLYLFQMMVSPSLPPSFTVHYGKHITAPTVTSFSCPQLTIIARLLWLVCVCVCVCVCGCVCVGVCTINTNNNNNNNNNKENTFMLKSFISTWTTYLIDIQYYYIHGYTQARGTTLPFPC